MNGEIAVCKSSTVWGYYRGSANHEFNGSPKYRISKERKMYQFLILILVLIVIGGIMYFMIGTSLFMIVGKVVLKSESLLVPLLIMVSIIALIMYFPNRFDK